MAELLMADISNRMRHLEQRNQELIHSLEFTQKEAEGLKKDKKSVKVELSNLKKEVIKNSEVEDKISKINDRLDHQEDTQTKQPSFFGLDEKPNES